MPAPRASEKLGPLDALFLYLEKKEMPMHIGSVLVFDGPIPMAGLKALIEDKLPLIPRYRQRLVFPPLYAGYPVWADDPAFDIDWHLRHAELKSGSMQELEGLAGQVFSEVMDRGRPLWDLTVVDGCEGGQSALIARVHHCLVDGIAGVRLMNIILDPSPKPLPSKKPRRFRPRPLPSAGELFADAMIGSGWHFMDRLLSAQSAALTVASEALDGLFPGQRPTVPAAGDLFPHPRPYPFHAPSSGPRSLAWAEFPLDEVNRLREAHGAKLNDIVLLIVADAVRRYAQMHRIPLKNRTLRLMVPVNLRGEDRDGKLGNRISLIPVNIPLEIANPLERLRTISQRTQGLKQAHAADLMVLGGSMLAILPVPVQAMLVGLLSNVVPVLPFDMVCTNVPGPQYPLYLLGREMVANYPYVPIGDFMGVNCAITSYNGRLFFGLTGDSKCAPNLDRLRDFLYEAFADIKGRAARMRNNTLPKPPLGEPIGTASVR